MTVESEAPTFTLIALDRAEAPLPLTCDVTRDPAGAGWTYYARPTAPHYEGLDGYELSLMPFGAAAAGRAAPACAWRVATLCNHLPAAFRGRGIGPALLLAAAARLGGAVCSSRTEGGAPDEYRTADANRVWGALVARDLASYDPADDRYTLAPNAPQAAPQGASEPATAPAGP